MPLAADLKTPLGRMFHYTDLNFIRNILTRLNADAEAWEQFESGIRAGHRLLFHHPHTGAVQEAQSLADRPNSKTQAIECAL